MPIDHYHGQCNKDGSVACGGPGFNCHVSTVVEEYDRQSPNYDSELEAIARKHNEMLAAHRTTKREDGRELRIFSLPSGENVLVWATCLGADATAADLRKRFGPPVEDPDEIRSLLGLRPRHVHVPS
jgi:hypothetical protein